MPTPVPASDLPANLQPVPAEDLPSSAQPQQQPAAPSPQNADPSFKINPLGFYKDEDFWKDLSNNYGRTVVGGVQDAVSGAVDLGASAVNVADKGINQVTGASLPTNVPKLGPVLNKKLYDQFGKSRTQGEKFGEEAGRLLASSLVPTGAAKAASTGEKVLARGAKDLVEDAKPLTQTQITAAKVAHNAGYDLSPRYIAKGSGKRDLMGISGDAGVHDALSSGNEVVTDRLAKAEIGLNKDEELSPENLQRLKNENYGAYDELRTLGTFKTTPLFQQEMMRAGERFAPSKSTVVMAEEGKKGADEASQLATKIDSERKAYLYAEVDANHAVENIKHLRDLARGNLRGGTNEQRAMGYAQRQIADTLEKELGRQAGAAGRPELVKNFVDARQRLAKIMDVEDAIGAGGHIRASDFVKMEDAGKKLSGNTKTIADTARHFPQDVKNVSEKGERPPFSVVDFLAGGTGIVTGHPQVAALSLSRPLVKKYLKSEGAQRSMIKNIDKTPRHTLRNIGKLSAAAGADAALGGAVEGTKSLTQADYGEGP